MQSSSCSKMIGKMLTTFRLNKCAGLDVLERQMMSMQQVHKTHLHRMKLSTQVTVNFSAMDVKHMPHLTPSRGSLFCCHSPTALLSNRFPKSTFYCQSCRSTIHQRWLARKPNDEIKCRSTSFFTIVIVVVTPSTF